MFAQLSEPIKDHWITDVNMHEPKGLWFLSKAVVSKRRPGTGWAGFSRVRAAVTIIDVSVITALKIFSDSLAFCLFGCASQTLSRITFEMGTMGEMSYGIHGSQPGALHAAGEPGDSFGWCVSSSHGNCLLETSPEVLVCSRALLPSLCVNPVRWHLTWYPWAPPKRDWN